MRTSSILWTLALLAALAVFPLVAPARTSTPARVRVTNQYSPTAEATPNTMIIRR